MLSITYLPVLMVLHFATYISSNGHSDSLLLRVVDYPFLLNLQILYSETVGDGRSIVVDRKPYAKHKRNLIPLWA